MRDAAGSIIKRAIKRAEEDGIGAVVVILFFFVLYIIVIVATANPKEHPFDTLIAFGGAAGQIWFAFAVWKLNKAQFNFLKIVSERQHRVDAYKLRKAALDKFDEVTEILTTPLNVNTADADAAWYAIIDMRALFSREIFDRLFAIEQAVQRIASINKTAKFEYDTDKGKMAAQNPYYDPVEVMAIATKTLNLRADVLALIETELHINVMPT